MSTPADAAPRPILVTGSHRSGTTWVGRMLAASPTPVGYIWEPFNPRHRPGTFPIRFPHYYHYVCAENAAECASAIADTLAFRYRPAAELRSLRSPRDAARMARDWARFTSARRRRAVPIVKDPIALLSSEWLADTFGMSVVVTIRHPAAFASSIKRRGWRHRFADFLDQPLLMRDLLGPHAGAIRACAAGRPDIVDEAVLLWNVLYGVVARFQARRPDWVYVRQEDIARTPLERFAELYASLGLAWDERVAARIRTTSTGGDSPERARVDSIHRRSAEDVQSWKRHLSAAEIERVRTGTAPLADRFYAEGDW